jgi:hypothetical protein
LGAKLAELREEKIASRCCIHWKVWDETCGGAEFMKAGMQPYWKDEGVLNRLHSRMAVREYPFTPKEEEAFEKLLAVDMKEGVVLRVRHEEVMFLCPVFMVEKKGPGEYRMVVDCRMVNAEQTYIHFRMDGPELVQGIAMEGDWVTSLDLKSTFNHMLVSAAFRPYLGFTHHGA